MPPPHFESINLPSQRYNLERSVSKWIYDNLKGRYYVGQSTTLNDQNQWEKVLTVSFENPKELSYFTLACPLLKY